MKKEWLLSISVGAITLVVAIGLIRWFAPQLLGIPVDLQAVRVSREIPPFYENIFRKDDYQSRDFILKDPFANVRAKPLYYDVTGFLGPHDILGFRNLNVPDVADVVVIGDSQTYGNNAVLENNWPSQFAKRLKGKRPVMYSMAVGGWGAVQYMNMLTYATVFLPRVVIVAFYTGNDPQESISLVYADERWAPLRPDIRPDLSSIPPSPGFPPPASETWPVHFPDGTSTVFSPSLRLVSNDTSYETVRAGYQVMEKAAQLMATTAQQSNFRLVLTIIPTKELVYSEKLKKNNIQATADYMKLISLEQLNISRLSQSFRSLPGVEYVDLVAPLQQAALGKRPLYPADMNGHPVDHGYSVISEALAASVGRYLLPAPQGLVGIDRGDGQLMPLLVNSQGVWSFDSVDLIEANGWKARKLQKVQLRDIVGLSQQGPITMVNPLKFGPASLR